MGRSKYRAGATNPHAVGSCWLLVPVFPLTLLLTFVGKFWFHVDTPLPWWAFAFSGMVSLGAVSHLSGRSPTCDLFAAAAAAVRGWSARQGK